MSGSNINITKPTCVYDIPKDGAKVFLNKMDIDMGTMDQIKKMIKHPAIDHARIMPDCQKGVGCCIGFTCKLGEKIVPSFIGGDIGCGITAHPIKKKVVGKEKQIDIIIQDVIPMGAGKHGIWGVADINTQILEEICSSSKREANLFIQSYKNALNVDLSKYLPSYSIDWWKKRSDIWKTKFDYDLDRKSVV